MAISLCTTLARRTICGASCRHAAYQAPFLSRAYSEQQKRQHQQQHHHHHHHQHHQQQHHQQEEGQKEYRADPLGRLIGLGIEDVLIIGAAFGGFFGTIYYFKHYTDLKVAQKMTPSMYFLHDILDVRLANSARDVTAPSDGEHVLLTVQHPTQITKALVKRSQDLELNSARVPCWRILSVFMKEPALQIERPYTPLNADAIRPPTGIRPIELLIKRYEGGELGRYAHRLHAGERLELRGPDLTWQGKESDHVVLLVGGTGVTPAYQLITSIFGPPERPFPRSDKIPRISLMYAAPKPSSLLLLPELKALQEAYGKYLNINLLVDAPDPASSIPSSGWTDWLLRRPSQSQPKQYAGLPLHIGRFDDRSVKATLDRHAEGERHILVCGPDAMVAHVAGPKHDKAQGEVGGILGRVGVREGEVFKL